MPPPSQHKSLTLSLLPELYYVKQTKELSKEDLELLNTSTFPSDGLFSITRTVDEVSIVGRGGTEVDAKWRCIKVAGPMDFGMHLDPAC